jgi:CRISPR/Cas system Type II protein with McrA/HNH and RuvC-like nuclease domain
MILRTLVLNKYHQPINIIGWQEAVVLLYKEVAETVVEWDKQQETYKMLEYDRSVANGDRKYVYKIPVIVRLLENKVLPKRKRLRFNRINLFYRDDYTCQYCGTKYDHGTKGLEIEHILPQSRGGKSSFENCVAACRDCNSKKADHTPEEAGMRLLRKPEMPNPVILMYKKMSRKQNIHESWARYLHYNTEIL